MSHAIFAPLPPFVSFLSASQGPCCTAECTYKTHNEKCREESECAHQGMCSGTSAQCPTSEPKANFTACHGETQVCLNGVRQSIHSITFGSNYHMSELVVCLFVCLHLKPLQMQNPHHFTCTLHAQAFFYNLE